MYNHDNNLVVTGCNFLNNTICIAGLELHVHVKIHVQ